jgi:Tfp pilus assembly protein PilF
VVVLAMALSGPASFAACFPKGQSGGPTPQSPERQSEDQYQVALDLFNKGNLRLALDSLRKALELDGDNAKASYLASAVHQAFCSGDLGSKSADCNLPEAERYARKALDADANFRDARNALGAVLINEGRYKEAIEVLRPLTQDLAYQANHLAWGNFGWAQVLGGQVDEGIVSLQNAVTQPKFCVGHYRLARALEKKRRLNEAEASLDNALASDGPAQCQGLQEAWLARGLLRLEMGKRDDAMNDLTKCRDLSTRTETGRECARRLSAAEAAVGTEAPR